MERLGEYHNIPKVAPFAWVGGKSKLAARIIEEFESHERYCEVFGGALNVFYRKPRSKLEVVNDINADLVNLHLQIQKRPQSLQLYLNRMLISRDIFAKIKNKSLQPRNDIQRAAYYFYLLSLSLARKVNTLLCLVVQSHKSKISIETSMFGVNDLKVFASRIWTSKSS